MNLFAGLEDSVIERVRPKVVEEPDELFWVHLRFQCASLNPLFQVALCPCWPFFFIIVNFGKNWDV